MEMEILLELIIGTVYALISLYACLKLALTIRPSRQKGWWKVRAYFIVSALLLGAVISGILLTQVLIYLL